MKRLGGKHLALLGATLLVIGLIAALLWNASSDAVPDAPPTPTADAAVPSGAKATRVEPSRSRRRKADAASAPVAEPTPVETAPAAAPPAGSGATVTVRVTSSATREALGGATVRVTDSDFGEWEGTSDAAGAVRFDDLPGGAIDVEASTPESVVGKRTLLVAAGAKELVDLALDPAASVEGIVVDAKDGSPIASADVEAIARSDAGDKPIADGTTDDSGRFRFAPVPAGIVVVLRATHFGYTRGEVVSTTPAAGGGIARAEVRLRRAGRNRGVALDPTGRPMPGVSIRLSPEDAPASAPAARYAESGQAGAYELREVPIGPRLLVVASSRGFGDSEPVAVALTEGAPESVVEVRLREAAQLRLTVTASDDGFQHASAQLDDGPQCFCSKEGPRVMAFHELTPGRHRYSVRSPGYATVLGECSVAPGEKASIDVKLDRGATISGVVVDRNGDPMPDVFVFASPVGGPREWTQPARSGPDGTFALSGLARGQYELFVFGSQSVGLVAHGHDSVRATAVAPASDVRVVAERDVLVTLRVVLPPGVERPPAVGVTQIDGSIAEPNFGGAGGETLPVVTEPWVRDGVIRCSIAPRASWLRVRLPGFAPELVLLAPTELGTTLDLGEIRMHVGLTLHGRVVNSAGEPVAGARVTTSADDWTTPFVLSRKDGTFEVEHLGPGPLVVRAETDGHYGASRLPSADDGSAASITLRRMGVLRGTVVDAAGVGVAGAAVSIQHGSAGQGDPGRKSEATTDATGTFSVTVVAGPCRGTARVGGTWIPFQGDVPEGAEASVRVVAPPPDPEEPK